MNKIVYLPLDERPCNIAYSAAVSEGHEAFSLVCPDNTLGTVICQGVLRYLYGDSAAHRKFIAHRIMDDAVYMADVRREMMGLGYGTNVVPVAQRGEVCERIIQLVNERTPKLCPSISEKYDAVDCYLPWHRLFEIGLKIKEK